MYTRSGIRDPKPPAGHTRRSILLDLRARAGTASNQAANLVTHHEEAYPRSPTVRFSDGRGVESTKACAMRHCADSGVHHHARAMRSCTSAHISKAQSRSTRERSRRAMEYQRNDNSSRTIRFRRADRGLDSRQHLYGISRSERRGFHARSQGLGFSQVVGAEAVRSLE